MGQTQRAAWAAPRIRRTVVAVIGLAGVAVFFRTFPPFHIVPLGSRRAAKEETKVNAVEFAEKLWSEQLTPVLAQAADARVVLNAIHAESQAAREKYGRTLGISNTYLVFLQGTGRVVKRDSKGVSLAVQGGDGGPDVVLPVGMIFGNTVRDATGLLDMDRFPNSQDFNAIAIELNRLVESRVLPQLREQAVVGREIRFVGCAEVSNDPNQRRLLKIIPLRVELLSTTQPK